MSSCCKYLRIVKVARVPLSGDCAAIFRMPATAACVCVMEFRTSHYVRVRIVSSSRQRAPHKFSAFPWLLLHASALFDLNFIEIFIIFVLLQINKVKIRFIGRRRRAHIHDGDKWVEKMTTRRYRRMKCALLFLMLNVKTLKQKKGMI